MSRNISMFVMTTTTVAEIYRCFHFHNHFSHQILKKRDIILSPFQIIGSSRSCTLLIVEAAMATTSKISLGDGSTVEMTRNEGVPDAIWNDVVKFVKENQKAVKKNPAIVKLLSQHPEQVPMLMNFTNDADSIKNFLQSQVLAANVSEDGQQEKMKALQEDPAFKPMFDDIKQNGPDVIMKYLGDEALMRKLSQKLGGITPEIMKQLTAINETSVPSAA